MIFFNYHKFEYSIVKLSQKGSSFKNAANKADSLIGKIARQDKDPLREFKVTRNGETRIKNCIKYDLCGRSRLVTVQSNGNCLLLFVGDHDATDNWLNSNKGMTFALNEDSQFVQVKSESAVIGESEPIIKHRYRQHEPLVKLLDESLTDRFLDKAPRTVQKKLDQLTSFDEQNLYEIASELEKGFDVAVKDTFLSLISGDIENATRTIQLFLGDIQPIEKIDVDSVIIDSEFLKKISSKSTRYPKLLRQFAERSEYKEWMLFMHPDQESIAFRDYKGPAKLLGVSGSGKTCIVIQRAIYLAKKYPRKPILIVTLNKPLAVLIEKLVNQLIEPEYAEQIEVKSFFSVCKNLLNTFEPENYNLGSNYKSGKKRPLTQYSLLI